MGAGHAVAAERWSWQPKPPSRESIKPTNVANLWINQRSQINEDTVESSLAAQDINPITYAPDLVSPPSRIRTQPADRPGCVLSLALAHYIARRYR